MSEEFKKIEEFAIKIKSCGITAQEFANAFNKEAKKIKMTFETGIKLSAKDIERLKTFPQQQTFIE